MLVGFEGESVNQEAKKLICDHGVGGIVYFNKKNGLSSPKQVKKLSSDLQQLAMRSPNQIPLFIAVDQEGGIVARLQEGFTIFPGNKAVATTQDAAFAEMSAKVMGDEMRAVGVNLNLAPVVDINNNPKNPVIGIRSYGETSEVVSRFARSALKGFQRAGLITTLKHFPGHGDVDVDSHSDLPVLAKSYEEIKNFELRPFFELAEHTDAIMTAHLMVPAIDAKNCSTLSAPCLDLIKKVFRGIIISDCLTMQGVLKNVASIEEAALKAINAGCDLILIGHGDADTMGRIKEHLIRAVQRGFLSENRVDQSIQKILHLKERIAPNASLKSSIPSEQVINSPFGRNLSLQIANKAIEVKRCVDGPSISRLKEKSCCLIALKMHQTMIQRSSAISMGKTRRFYFIENFEPQDDEIQMAANLSAKADVAIIYTFNAWRFPRQIELLQTIDQLQKSIIHIATRDSTDTTLFPKAKLSLSTHSPTQPSFQAASDYLIQHC